MLTERTLYEGLVHGMTEYRYRKLIGHLRNAFEEVDYEYHGDSGTLLVRGVSDMFDADHENLTATFDLLVDQFQDDARGVILEKKWSLDGTVTVNGYFFKGKSWSVGSLDFEDR